ncbi:ATP-binding protein [Streptomyces sp. NPDC001941]|uniref:ATP-binding protein n=1 Tax=Streptomyces sp. NPDC001941 TaxID=3154659 RepID=UPI0033215D42
MAPPSTEPVPTAPDDPLSHTISWDDEPQLIGEARDAARRLLARAGYGPEGQASKDAQLIVSELVTNAVRFAPGPGSLVLDIDPPSETLRITVRDSSRRRPRPQHHDRALPGGHGLRLVALLCTYLETSVTETGKQVVAHFRLPGAPRPRGGALA